MSRKMVSIPEDEYRQLVKAKGKLEMETGVDVSIGETIGYLALGFLAGYAAKKIIDYVLEEDD